MTIAALLTELQTRGVELTVDGGTLRYRGPKGALTGELREALTSHKAELMRVVTQTTAVPSLRFDLDDGTVAAVLIRHTHIGEIWIAADPEVLADHPSVLRSRLPIVFFDELEHLRGKTALELQAIGLIKSTFPTGRVLQ